MLLLKSKFTTNNGKIKISLNQSKCDSPMDYAKSKILNALHTIMICNFRFQKKIELQLRQQLFLSKHEIQLSAYTKSFVFSPNSILISR